MSPLFLIVDLFCGAGGTTTGFAQAAINGKSIAKVIACVNHDPIAIKSHWGNHPEVKHFEEDIRTLDLTELVAVVNFQKALYADAKLILWASLECTNFSKAKGGQPRDADSRTLADHLDRYIDAIDPDYVQIENVVEFMSWGPLDANGKPVSRKNGQDWMRWRERICSHGYRDEWKELNSANFGAFTSRNRLFGVFAKHHLPIQFPSATHAKVPSKAGMHGDLEKWKAVKEVLDFSDEGISIFNRKVPLVNASLDRIYAGLLKFVAKGDKSFISKYFSGKPANKNITIDGPAGTIKCKDGQALIQTEFLVKYNSMGKDGSYSPPSIEEPAPVVATQNRLYLATPKFLTQRNSGEPQGRIVDVEEPARTLTTTGGNMDLVSPEFLAAYYGNGDNVTSVEDPGPTIPTKDRFSLVQPEYFLDKQYTGYKNNQSIDVPAGTLMPNDKHSLIRTEPFITPTNYTNGPKSVDEPAPTITANRKHHYLVNPSWGGNPGSVDAPCCVIVARQDKAPLSFIQVEHGRVSIPVYDTDSEVMIKIKQFMVAYEIIDIKMRMLRVHELLRIQGFPADYRLEGNQSDQKKFIGNSVVPHVVKAWAEAMARKLTGDSWAKVA